MWRGIRLWALAAGIMVEAFTSFPDGKEDKGSSHKT